jgi:hypothetical protein
MLIGWHREGLDCALGKPPPLTANMLQEGPVWN